MPRNQITTEIPLRPVWVIGLEYLELSLLNWFVTTQMLSVMTPAVADAEVSRGLTRERIEELLATGQMLFRRNTTLKLQQYYTFFTKNMVKAVRNHSDKILSTDSSLFSSLTNLEFEAHALDSENFYRAQSRQQVILTFRTDYNRAHDFNAETQRYRYYVRDRNTTGYILASSRFPEPNDINSRGVGPSVAYTDSWISNPQHVRLPEHVINSLSYQNRTSESYAIVSPINNRFVDKASYILDWLSSEDAPKNLSKLNYFDALRQAGEWHEERTRRRNAAMRTPVRDGDPIAQAGGIEGRDLNVFVGGRLAGRTTQFRAMFDQINATTPVQAATRKYMSVPVTEADYTLIWERHGWRVFALESNAAFVKESELMSHCIGESPRYWHMKEDDPHHYIAMTLRSPAEPGLGKATATFDYYPTRGFTQLKGVTNGPLTLGASDMFAQFLDDIARIGIAYVSPLFVKPEEEYANGTEGPNIYARFDGDNTVASTFHGNIQSVKNYLDRSAHIPENINSLLNPITKSSLADKPFWRIDPGAEVQVRFLGEAAPVTQEQTIQELIANDPNPCNEVELPVGMEQQPSRIHRPGDDTPPPAVVTVETGQATTIHLPDAPEGTTFRIYRNRGN